MREKERRVERVDNTIVCCMLAHTPGFSQEVLKMMYLPPASRPQFCLFKLCYVDG